MLDARRQLMRIRTTLAVVATFLCGGVGTVDGQQADRSPVDVALTTDGAWLATVNETSDSASLVRLSDHQMVHEIRLGDHPTAIERIADSQRFLAACRDSGELILLEVAGGQLRIADRLVVGGLPVGIAVSEAGDRAWAALSGADEIVELLLPELRETRRIAVGRLPRYLAVNPQGTRLIVGVAGERGVSIVDLEQGEVLYTDRFVGLNVGHLQATRDGQAAYYPWMVYRNNPISVNNIQLGWVLASRIARSNLQQHERREAMSLDPRGKAIADPHGLRLTADEQRLVVSASGTRELLLYRVAGLPLKAHGGPDHIDPELLTDRDRFDRIELGGRPMGLRIAADDRTVYVANYLLNSVQVVGLPQRAVLHEIPLGGPSKPSLARRGAEIFYDARRSLDQWYSCHTCHYEGGGNSVVMDTWNDGSARTTKTVLPLYDVVNTGPWTWHGWQTDLRDAMRKSLTTTMQGKEPSDAEVDAMLAFLGQLRRPPNPQGTPSIESGRGEAIERGRLLFASERAACSTCHSGDRFSDGQVHDVGTGDRRDRYDGYNTPSLLGVRQKTILMHDGKVASLEDLLKGPHNPAQVAGSGEPLTEQEILDLVAYLRSL